MRDMAEFPWPCGLHEVHDAHHVNWVGDCPGVLVHPATQIGGNYR